MNFVDIVILVPLLYAAWVGFRKGLIIEVFTLLALLVGIYAGIHFSDWTSNLIKDKINIEGRYLPVVAFTLTFLGVGAMVYFAGKMIERMLKVVNLSPVNKILGLFFGVIKMLYTLSILIILIETYDERGNFIPKDVKNESYLYNPVRLTASATIPAIEESTIWLKNSVNDNFFDGQDLNLDNFQELKNKADSLGLTLEDLKLLKEQYKDSLNLNLEQN
ncbi:CvpA family protein [Brumimicrobium mesophilum]|uniref:CvpA family protein n=1 Tax=Brumimicrobium mesophilum TaxID=392717 RepID=UPI000D13F67B|nr:CvpA family protein [Brumimicrobium mesophilum]